MDDRLRIVPNSVTCECECNRAECGHNIVITIDDYEAVRARGRHFIVAPDHQTQDELTICAGRGYLVIEKVGESGLLAQALNPR